MKSLSCFIAYIFVVSLPLTVLSAADTQEEKEVLNLLQSAEFKAPEQERMDVLGKQSVIIPTRLLEQNYGGLDVARVIATLARQYLRHKAALSESESQLALKVIVAKTLLLKDTPLIQVLVALKGLNSDEVRSLASEFRDDPHEDVRKAATALLNSIAVRGSSQDASPKSISISPNPPPKGSSETRLPQLPFSTPSEEPTSSTPWSIIAVVSVGAMGLLCWLIKRRS